jgi:hypothetical protein
MDYKELTIELLLAIQASQFVTLLIVMYTAGKVTAMARKDKK